MKRLLRSRSDRVLFGVCGGFGQYLGVDANLVRVAWIICSLFGGIGVLPYIAAVVIVPEEDDGEPASGSVLPRIVGLGLIAFGAFLLLRAFGVEVFRGRFFEFWTLGVFVPMALFVAGVFLVWPRARQAFGLGAERRARRSVTDRVLAGVCGGLARELGVDANLLRVLFVLAAGLTSGFFLLVYLLLVLVMPEGDPHALLGRRPVRAPSAVPRASGRRSRGAGGRSRGPPRAPPGAVKALPGVADDHASRVSPVILRALLALLLGWAAWRFVRRLFAGLSPAAPPRPKGSAGSARLDPDRAVTATWSEVEEEKKTG